MRGSVIEQYPDNWWVWCTCCGMLWAKGTGDDEGLAMCICDDAESVEFPDPEVVRAARAIGGDEAVHAIERQLYLDWRFFGFGRGAPPP